PCQDISTAGKGAGLHGERSGLWWEFHRLLRDVGPRLVVVENVEALRSRGFDAVVGSLAELGFVGTVDEPIGGQRRRHPPSASALRFGPPRPRPRSAARRTAATHRAPAAAPHRCTLWPRCGQRRSRRMPRTPPAARPRRA
ncbi:MAG: DNA cytosine methyltransferase, partial [Deltaproteobacteria bacterium]|nr:DNA cytosine methyltransferase [Deltaproteobacteria bacterium]